MIKKLKQILKSDKLFFWITLIIYFLCVIYITIHHEFTQDETQSFLIARDLNPIDIIKQMRYEGHSFLWHFLLFPFAKLGLSIYTQKIIPVIFSTATIYLILKHAPFSKILKILITFSSGMIYYYSSFARPYCIIPFLLVSIAIIYKKRKEKPYLYAILVGLLAHTHLVMLPTAGLLVLTFWIDELVLKRKELTQEEKSKLIKSLILVISIIFIYLFIILYGYFCCKIPKSIQLSSSISNYISYWAKYTLHSISATFYGSYYIIVNTQGPKVPIFYIILIFIFLILCIIGSKNNIKQAIIFWSQFLFMTIIHAFFWFYLPIRIFLIIYTLMFWVWMNHNEDKNNKWTTIALILIIIMSIPGTYKCVHNDINKKASAGIETVEFIKKNIPKKSVLINTHVDFQQILAAYLNKDEYLFYSASASDFRTFNIWDQSILKEVTSKDVLMEIKKLKKEYKNIYLLIPVLDNYYGINTIPISKKYNINYIYIPKKEELMKSYYMCDLVTFYIVEIRDERK